MLFIACMCATTLLIKQACTQACGFRNFYINSVSIMRKKALSAMMVATGSRDTGVKELEEMKSVSDIHALTATEEGPVSLPVSG